jgi:hypothetical protein
MLRRLREWNIRRALDPARHARARAARDPEYREHLERYAAAERPVLDALGEAGLRVKRLPDLINRDIDYDAQVGVLIEWLPRVSYPPAQDTVARALTVPAARPAAADPLLAELRKAPRDPLAFALAYTADASHFDAIAQLIEDPSIGSARSSLIEHYIGRFPSRRDDAIPILRRLLADDDLGRYSLAPLARLRAAEARPEIERFLEHDQEWVRRAARRALAKLDG